MRGFRPKVWYQYHYLRRVSEILTMVAARERPAGDSWQKYWAGDGTAML
jgi:hypothetical protein